MSELHAQPVRAGLGARVHTAVNFLRSYFLSMPSRRLFGRVERYCMFIGYPRSGHSLIGSLLDAHPDIIIAHELDALKYVEMGYTERQIYYLLLEQSKRFTNRGRRWAEFTYFVPNQWNGRFRRLRVIGDKKGGRSTLRLGNNPMLLDDLKKTISVDLKLIHVVRNPYDNISTMSKMQSISLANAIDQYFDRCRTVDAVRAKTEPGDWIDLRHESLIQDPIGSLGKLCTFLEVDVPEDYLRDCAAIVYKSPHLSRLDADWTEELIARVELKIMNYPFLHGYRFHEPIGL